MDSMNTSNLLRVVADTNVYFISLYNPESKAGKLLTAAIEKKVTLFSPDTVREELKRILIRELGFAENGAENVIIYLPVTWVGKEVYANYMKDAFVIKHTPDRPVLATALAMSTGIITANIKDFKPAQKIVKLWKIDELLKAVG